MSPKKLSSELEQRIASLEAIIINMAVDSSTQKKPKDGIDGKDGRDGLSIKGDKGEK